MDDLQFYPTPKKLAQKAWATFKNRDFSRVLEPSAGAGDLAGEHPGRYDSWHRVKIECCEIDISKHPILREAGYAIVGLDFLQFSSAAAYSHILMNPPFAQGARHVLKAWDILFDGEIVAILNAETIRNPYTKERQMLTRIIEQHGSVEFIEEAFMDPDTKRKTEVEVALVYLVKEANYDKDIVGSLMEDLKRDSMSSDRLAEGYQEMNELVLPNTLIENAVLTFNAAVRAMRESVQAEARAQHYSNLIGKTLTEMNGNVPARDAASTLDFVRTELGKRYDKLKNQAWSNILRSTDVLSKLSSAAQGRLEAEFESIKQLEFSVSNIRGFLLGLVESQGEIQLGMACDVFDQITRYYSDNTVYYRGWKSNDKHRTCGIRIKGTRFILPGHRTDSWRDEPSWGSLQLLRDFDKVFAMLDGKQEPEYGLTRLFQTSFNLLRTSKRMSTDYFDVRYFKGMGTIHFYPRDVKLIDRLNRLVGHHRQWLPPEGEAVPEAFWLQYDQAEKLDKEVREEVARQHRSSWDNPFWKLSRGRADGESDSAEASIDAVLASVQERHGISIGVLEASKQMPLLLAA
jgi:hypothetical protein